MGCSGSKQAQQDHRPPATLPSFRRYSVAVHAGGGNNHVVTLTSSTLGSLQLDYYNKNRKKVTTDDDDADCPLTPPEPERIEREPEVINAWELMEGLDDDATDRLSSAPADDCFVASEFDPEILSSITAAISEGSPQREQCTRSCSLVMNESVGNGGQDSKKSIVRARIEAFQQKIDAKRAKINGNAVKLTPLGETKAGGQMVGSKGKVVLYFTSLRGVRKTFEDCWSVKMILKSYGFRIDERDVSMHSGFKEELVQMLGSVSGRGRLPHVFAGGRYLGGADEVRQLHEAGELLQELEGCEMILVSPCKGGVEVECQGCGDARFVPCEACSGSCKLYVEEEDVLEFGSFRRCPDCNENGLVRCPLCCC